jgi:hypothetical protein
MTSQQAVGSAAQKEQDNLMQKAMVDFNVNLQKMISSEEDYKEKMKVIIKKLVNKIFKRK